MTHKPRMFLLISLALTGVLISFPLQVVFIYSHTMGEFAAVLNKISFLNMVCMLAVGYTSYLAYQASPRLRWCAPLTIALIFWNNLIVGHYATDFSMSTTAMATMGFAVMFTPLLTPTARYILSDEKRRWWLRPARYKKRVSTTINPFVGTTIHAHTFDISSTGAFIHLDQDDKGQAPKVGESIRISMNIGGMRNVRCEAIIVRVTEPKGSYPTGLGLQFKEMDRLTQKDLDRFLTSNSSAVDC